MNPSIKQFNEVSMYATPEFESFISNQSDDDRLECLDPLELLIRSEEMNDQD